MCCASLALSISILGTGSFWPSADERGTSANVPGVSGSGFSLAALCSWSGVLRDLGEVAGSNDVPNEAAASFTERLFCSSDKSEGFLEAQGLFNGEDTSTLFGGSIAFDMDRLSLVFGESAVWKKFGMMLRVLGEPIVFKEYCLSARFDGPKALSEDGEFAALRESGVFEEDEKSTLFETPTVSSGARVFVVLEGLCSFDENGVSATFGNSKFFGEGGISAFFESTAGVSGAGLFAVLEDSVPSNDGTTPSLGRPRFSASKLSCDGSSRP